jgi:hypothetical protein
MSQQVQQPVDMRAVVREEVTMQTKINEVTSAFVERVMGEKLGAVEKTVTTKIDEKVGAVEKMMGAVEKTMGEKMGAVEKTMGEKVGAVEKTMGEKVGAVEKTMGEKVGAVEKTMGEKVGAVEKALGAKIDTNTYWSRALLGAVVTVVVMQPALAWYQETRKGKATSSQ